MQLGLVSPWDKRDPNLKQGEFLNKLLFEPPRPGQKRHIVHFVGGRGAGKSASLILALLESCHNINPGLPHLWTSPTLTSAEDSFYDLWREAVPPELYRENKSKHIVFYNNGQVETPIKIRSRDTYNSKKDAHARGGNYAAAFIDEPAIDKTNKSWLTMFPSVRNPKARRLMIGTASTPKLGWYKDLVVNGSAMGRSSVIYSTSYDNVHQDNDGIEEILRELDPKLAQQEVFAKWISLSDRIWDNIDLSEHWPNGNLHHHRYTTGEPFWLACDIGNRSAWLIMQTISVGFGNEIDVAVGEYTPNHGDTDKIATMINADYGEPDYIVVGSDVTTGSIHDGTDSVQVLRALGWQCPITPVRGRAARKNIQLMSAKRSILNALGERLFCVSEHLQSHDRNGRGIREVLEQDEWPSEAPKVGQYLPKDKQGGGIGLEDMRDAFLYAMVIRNPVRGFRGELAA